MEQNSCPAWSVWSQLRCQRRRSSSVSFYTVLKVSPKRLPWLWSTFGLDPSSDTLLIFRRYNFQKSSLRELHKEYNKYYLKYHGSKGLVSSSSSFFPERISAAERRGQVTPSNSTDQGPSPKRLRQLELQILFNKFAKISTKHHYNTRLSAKECFSVNFSRTEKSEKNISLELVFLFGILFHILLKLSTYLIFVKKLNHYSLIP